MERMYKIRWPEQLDSPAFCPAASGTRKFLKRQMRRARRRDGKLNKDNALKINRYYGWES